MNEIDTALVTVLTNGSGLTTLLAHSSSVYAWQAPDSEPTNTTIPVEYPFVLFNDMSDTEGNDTSHEIHDTVYQVRGFTKQSMKAAKAIDYQIRLLLHNQALSVSGFRVLKSVRIGSVRFVENQQSTDKVYSAGGLYRIRVERTA